MLMAGAATAQTEKNPPREKSRGSAAAAPVPAFTASAPSVRLAALINSDGGLVKNKGVESVERIGTGVYCILPKSSTGIDPTTVIVTVSVEFYYSVINEVQVQWASRGSGCGKDRIGVYTLSDFNANGFYALSNDVGFTIIVP
jgi:hypothetical protein